MKLLQKYQTGNPILDNLISSTIWVVIIFGIGLIFYYVPNFLVQLGLLSTDNKAINEFIIKILFFIFLLIVVFFIWKLYKIWHWSSGRTHRYLKELKNTLKTVHSGIRPSLAYIAKESAAHLITTTPDKAVIGEDVTINEYIRLLQESIQSDKLIDVTFIAKTKPSLWGDCDNPSSCTDIQKHAWNYFEMQKRIKDENRSVRMRRFLAISKNDFDNDVPTLKDKFITKHAESNIDLLLLPPDNVTDKHKGFLRDMAIFWTSDLNGWVVCSDFKEEDLKHNKVSIFITYQHEALLNIYSDFMSEVIRILRKVKEGAYSNCYAGQLFDNNNPPNDFLEEINVHI